MPNPSRPVCVLAKDATTRGGFGVTNPSEKEMKGENDREIEACEKLVKCVNCEPLFREGLLVDVA